MLLASLGGDPPFHQAFVADAGRVRELSGALGKLRSERDPELAMRFFDAYADAHERAERALELRVGSHKWQARWLEVKDFLKARMPSDWSGREEGDSVVIRKLGWVRLDRELGRARSLLRIGAPESVLAGQRKRVRDAFLATSWKDQHAPPPPPRPSFDFWKLPVHASEAGEMQIGDLDPHTSAQQAWGHAQELVERGLELCIPPLAEPVGLGGHATLETDGELLIDTRSAAHPSWVEPTWRPCFCAGERLLELESSVHAKPGAMGDEVARVRRRLGNAARTASADGRAIVWWIDPAW